MINALQLAIDFHNQLPNGDRPELTDEGRRLLPSYECRRNCWGSKASYIIRDFDTVTFENAKNSCAPLLIRWMETHGERVHLELKDQYYNMRQVIERHDTYQYCKGCYGKTWHQTDYRAYSWRNRRLKDFLYGYSTPNIFAGGENMHGRFMNTSVCKQWNVPLIIIIGIISYRDE